MVVARSCEPFFVRFPDTGRPSHECAMVVARSTERERKGHPDRSVLLPRRHPIPATASEAGRPR